MRSLCATLLMGVLWAGIPAGLAQAEPGDSGDQPRLEILRSHGVSCPVVGGICFIPGADETTLTAASTMPALSAQAATRITPQFSRITSSLKPPSGTLNDDPVPWTVELNASLRQRSWVGNAVVLVYDLEDPKALAHHEVAAVWQAPIPATNDIKARLTLSPDDGFHAGHTYRIQIVQIISRHERVLAEGDLRLM